jgi:hypothetical protein
MRKPSRRHVNHQVPCIDSRIQEIADELLRMSRRIPMRLSGDSHFLQLVAQVLTRENQLVNHLKGAVVYYDQILNSTHGKMNAILKPPPEVIEVPFESEVVTTVASEY